MKIRIAVVMACLAMVATAAADQSIADVQQALKDQGFYYGEINGQKDADTVAAIRRYQIRNGLQITGELNDETLRSIKSASANSQLPRPAPSAPGGPPPPVTGGDTSDLRENSAPQNPGANPPARQPFGGLPPNQWQPGPSTGQPLPSTGGLFSGTPYQIAPIEVQRRVIADAQRILAKRGLFKDEIDGAYGPALEFSLRAYQSRIGLPTTGRLDLETLAALQLLPGAHVPIFTPRRPGMPSEPPVRGEWVRP
jgi:peptidoglycan hydrolase-like protein with peptidoglycan-binding domain